MTDRPIVLDADFDSGSLDVERSSVRGDTVHLAGRDNFNTGCWKWLHFTASNVRGRTLVFQIGDNFDTDRNRLNHLQMIYREDGERWRYFDHNQRDAEAGLYSFGNRGPFTSDRVTGGVWVPLPVVARRVTHGKDAQKPVGSADRFVG